MFLKDSVEPVDSFFIREKFLIEVVCHLDTVGFERRSMFEAAEGGDPIIFKEFWWKIVPYSFVKGYSKVVIYKPL